MPLIVISGYPCSGKTTRAQQILAYFADRISVAPAGSREARLRVHIVNTESLALPSPPRSTGYVDARAEKQLRAAEYSAVKRLLTKDDVVIADGLNYIKGLRYQLFCEAKAALTPSCVVHVATPPETCRQWNAARDPAKEEDRYPDEVLDNLIFRYEEPNGMARWDSPLFTVPYVDAAADVEGIWKAVVSPAGAVVKANQATVLKPAAQGDYLHELGKTTQEIVALVMERSSEGGGETIAVPGCSVALQLPTRSVTIAELQRLRRDFIKLNRTHVVAMDRVGRLFVEYLNVRLD